MKRNGPVAGDIRIGYFASCVVKVD
jgi:hypothetical protein